MEELNIEEMRRQMDILRNKLEQQQIVSDRMVRRSMKKSVVNINKRYLLISTLCLLMIPYGYWAFVRLNGMSIGFWLVTSVLMLIVFGYTYWNGKALRNDQLLDGNLLDAYRTVAQAKKRDHDWLRYGIPLGLLWIAYFCYESFRLSELLNDGLTRCYLGIISGLIGLAVGLKLHFRTQRNYREILEQIEEVTRE